MKKTVDHLSSYFLLFVAFYLILTRNISIYYNLPSADLLVRETIYQGFFINHEPLHNFIMMASPDFLQLLLYCSCRLVFNMPHTIIIVTLLSIYLFYFLFLQIAKILSQNTKELQLYQGVILLGITLLAYTPFWPMDSFNASLNFDDHFFNTGVMELFSLWLVLQIIYVQKKIFLSFFFLFAAVFCTSVSDPSYLVCFVAPALLSISFRLIHTPKLNKKTLTTGSIILIAGGLGYFALLHLNFFHININYNHLENPLQRDPILMLQKMLRGFLLLMQHNLVLFFLWIMSILYLFKINPQNRAFSFVQVFLLNVIMMSLIAMFFLDPDILPDSTTDTLNTHFFTHSGPMLYLPLFFMSVRLIQNFSSESAQKKLTTHFKSALFLIQIAILYLTIPAVSLVALFGNPEKNWPWIHCVQQAQTEYHLQEGIADYWVSRPLILYTHLAVEQITPDLHPYYWLTDIQSLQAKIANFAVVDGHGLKASTIIKTYGPPAQNIFCPVNAMITLQIMVYPKGIQIDRTPKIPTSPK